MLSKNILFKQRPISLFVNRKSISTYCDRHIGPQFDTNDHKIMLEKVGYKSIDDLIADTIPSHIRLNKDEMDHMSSIIGKDGKSESNALKELKDKMNNNIINKSYIGMGYYDTLTPTPILRNIIENPSWYTPYTPYQAEIAQGRLEMLLNFQTMIKDIVGKEISNASLLDESTACAEAMTMCLNMSKKKFKQDQCPIFLVSDNCHPQNIAVIKQRAEPVGIKINVISDDKFENELKNNGDLIFGAIIQYPNTFGNIYNNLQSLVDIAHNNGILMIASTDLFACSILKPPGEYGIDIVVGSAQRFGVPLGFGGPHAAFLACDDLNIRKMPGRLIGITKDSRNKPALRMALQTREQFIRRDKATSNICTAQALLANVAAAYAVYHGPNGIKKIANKIHLYTKILSYGITQELKCCENINKLYFDTVTFKINPNIIKNNTTETILNIGYENGINLRPINNETLSISIDETTSLNDINNIFKVFNNSMNNPIINEPNANDLIEICTKNNNLTDDIIRNSNFMEHETFNTYHCETSLMRYLYQLERKDLGLNTAMMPLGSCTMKLNSASVMIPVTWDKVNNIHPFAPNEQTKGYQSLINDMENMLASITGFDAISLQPNSGAAGEYTGLSTIRQYHKQRNEEFRNICLIPTSAHGTNPASAAMCGYKIVAIKCDSQGYIDMIDLKQKAEQHKNELGACMITYPSTHGVFEDNIIELCDIIHKNGGLVYMDGANLQAQLTKTSPAKIGADVCHLNLHKTFCIPHGGGGPGLGPIGVNNKLKPYLPSHPMIENGSDNGDAIGPVSAAPYSSASILTIPWMYIKMMGFNGLEKATSTSILAANYMAKRLENHYKILYRRNGLAAHEFIIDCRHFYKKNVDSKKKDDYIYKIEAEDIAKRLMDYSFHAPTMSWPVVNTLMVEPTESEPLQELDRFCDAMIGIRKEIEDVENDNININDSPLRNSPHTIDTLISDNWDKKYSRKEASVNPYKSYWPSVGRVNNPYGDLNKICACPSVEDLVKIQQAEQDAKSMEN